MTIIDGKSIAEKIREKLKKEVSELKKPPVLAVILVGNDPASELYVKIKENVAEKIGIEFKKFLLGKDSFEKDVLMLIEKLNNDSEISAIVVQLPLPNGLNTENIVSAIDPAKDADALCTDSNVLPPTAEAIMEIFKYYKISLKNKKIVIVGHGRLVGKPLSKIFKKKNIPHVVCTSETKNLKLETKKADILISATGVSGLITENMIKKGAVIIDAGTSVEKPKAKNLRPKTLGDIDFKNVQNKASFITPSAGGVGPLTVAKLFENVVKLAK